MALDVPYRSIPDMFLKRVAATPDSQAFGHPGAGRLRAGLARPGAGRRRGPRPSRPACTASASAARTAVAILANTRLDWVVADLGIMCAGGGDHHGLPDDRARGRLLHRRRLRLEGA